MDKIRVERHVILMLVIYILIVQSTTGAKKSGTVKKCSFINSSANRRERYSACAQVCSQTKCISCKIKNGKCHKCPLHEFCTVTTPATLDISTGGVPRKSTPYNTVSPVQDNSKNELSNSTTILHTRPDTTKTFTLVHQSHITSKPNFGSTDANDVVNTISTKIKHKSTSTTIPARGKGKLCAFITSTEKRRNKHKACIPICSETPCIRCDPKNGECSQCPVNETCTYDNPVTSGTRDGHESHITDKPFSVITNAFDHSTDHSTTTVPTDIEFLASTAIPPPQSTGVMSEEDEINNTERMYSDFQNTKTIANQVFTETDWEYITHEQPNRVNNVSSTTAYNETAGNIPYMKTEESKTDMRATVKEVEVTTTERGWDDLQSTETSEFNIQVTTGFREMGGDTISKIEVEEAMVTETDWKNVHHATTSSSGHVNNFSTTDRKLFVEQVKTMSTDATEIVTRKKFATIKPDKSVTSQVKQVDIHVTERKPKVFRNMQTGTLKHEFIFTLTTPEKITEENVSKIKADKNTDEDNGDLLVEYIVYTSCGLAALVMIITAACILIKSWKRHRDLKYRIDGSVMENSKYNQEDPAITTELQETAIVPRASSNGKDSLGNASGKEIPPAPTGDYSGNSNGTQSGEKLTSFAVPDSEVGKVHSTLESEAIGANVDGIEYIDDSGNTKKATDPTRLSFYDNAENATV